VLTGAADVTDGEPGLLGEDDPADWELRPLDDGEAAD